jgi:hypothetical protein
MKQREPTHQRDHPWPFLYSVTKGKLRRNLPPQPRERIKLKKEKAK